MAALGEGWRNRIESSVAPWEPIERSEVSVYSLFASLELVACGRRTFRYMHCRWRSCLKCRFKKSVSEQKFGNSHCSQSSVKSEHCEAALEC